MYQLLNPDIINSIEGLELLSRQVVGGFMAGANRSQRSGQGQEFQQYRSYQPGDDLRMLDWKMYGRSDRYYIKESEVETNISLRFVMDTSASMLHEEAGFTKLEYARVMAAALAWLGTQQGDAIGLYALNQAETRQLTTRQNRQHFQRFCYELLGLQARGRFPEHETESELFYRQGNKEMVIIFSDMYEHGNEISAFLEKLAVLKNEVLFFQLMGRDELELDYRGTTALQDLETGQLVQVNPDSFRKQYRQQLRQKLEEIQQKMLDMGISWHLFPLNEPVETALATFLERRGKLF